MNALNFIREKAAIATTPFWNNGDHEVHVTPAGQLAGSHASLCRFREVESHEFDGRTFSPWADYLFWESHHIMEKSDQPHLAQPTALGVSDDQPCVLLPREMHRALNSTLHSYQGVQSSPEELIEVYKLAHANHLENYTGSGESEDNRAELNRSATAGVLACSSPVQGTPESPAESEPAPPFADSASSAPVCDSVPSAPNPEVAPTPTAIESVEGDV